MSVTAYQWENDLLELAHKAQQSRAVVEPLPTVYQTLLAGAYDHVKKITQEHSKTFFTASALLPETKKMAIHALYAFCRISDDLVDRAEGDSSAMLETWRQRSLDKTISGNDLVALAWFDARQKFGIPLLFAEQLIDGVARDLRPVSYRSFSELAVYCYGVASTVGLMSMHVIGYQSQEAVSYAIRMGVALQLTNILRDIGEDWRNGRLYLPLEELEAFNLSFNDLARGIIDERWRNFMRFQIDRNRKLYRLAEPGIALLYPEGRFAVTAAAEIYGGILNDIEKNDYDVFSRRAYVSKWGKIRRLPKIWLKSKTARPPAPKSTSEMLAAD